MMQSVDELLGQLRGVTGPEVALPPEPFAWQPWLLAIAVVVAGGAGWLWFRRPKILPPPDVEANDDLKRLPAQPTEAAYMQCESIARRYLERRHLLPARALTPVELNGHIDEAWRDLLHNLQVQRFAPAQSAPDAWPRLVRQLESLIQGDGGNLAGQ